MPKETDIKMRKGTAAAWASANPVLSAGEPGFESDTKKLKLGDGSTAWNSLPYFRVDGGELVGGPTPTPSGTGPTRTPTPTPSPTPTGFVNCPAPWMKILLDDGSQIAAGDLKVGMKVLTQHEDTLETGSYEVTHVSTVHSERLKLTIGRVDFVCSKSHKFYSEGSWIEAESLQVGDVIGDSTVLAVREFDAGEVVKITVDSAHTYICEGLLSHNKSEYIPMMKPSDTNVSW
jgi:hypothetical protein